MAADRERLDAAWTALAELGVTLADLQRDTRPALPTFNDYLPQVSRRPVPERCAPTAATGNA